MTDFLEFVAFFLDGIGPAMDIFFSRSPQQQVAPDAVGGYIAYYGLTDWWLTSFSAEEREEIAYIHTNTHSGVLALENHPLAEGVITHAPQTTADFVIGLAARVSGQDALLGERIRGKGLALGGEPHPGYLNGRRRPGRPLGSGKPHPHHTR